MRLFISHASEDKASIVRPLAEGLTSVGLDVWFDEYELTLGDSLRQVIDGGLADCDFAVVVLSNNFFEKAWPQAELDGLFARELSVGRKVILPIWHDIGVDAVARFSPVLASRLAANSRDGVPALVLQIQRAIGLGVAENGPVSSEPSLIHLFADMCGHLDALRYSLTSRYMREVESGDLAVSEWPEPLNAQGWFVRHSVRLPSGVRDGFRTCILGYQVRLNNHLEFLRAVVGSGRTHLGDTTVEVEHLRRLHALVDQFDVEANRLRRQDWLV